MTDKIYIWAQGSRRGLCVERGGRRMALLNGDGTVWTASKQDIHGAAYGMPSEATHVLKAMDRPDMLKVVSDV